MVAVSGSGGVGGVGAGVSADALVPEKQTTAYVSNDNLIDSQGDIAIDANAKQIFCSCTICEYYRDYRYSRYRGGEYYPCAYHA